MELKYKNYKILPENGRFNLFEIKATTIKKNTTKYKKGDKVKIINFIGYGFTFENLLKRIITNELEKKKEIITLKQYIDTFKEELEIINNILKNE